MTITKELTNHSLPEIGDAFGGRDHTTVIHAYRKIKELRENENRIDEDFSNLINTLTSWLLAVEKILSFFLHTQKNRLLTKNNVYIRAFI